LGLGKKVIELRNTFLFQESDGDRRCGELPSTVLQGETVSDLDYRWASRGFALENPQGRAYNHYVNIVMFTMST